MSMTAFIPVGSAMVCLNCENVYDALQHDACPVCASVTTQHLTNWIGELKPTVKPLLGAIYVHRKASQKESSGFFSRII